MSETPGASDFVDPTPSARLSRKNILALVLTITGVILALFFSSRRGPAPRYSKPVSDPAGYADLAPITISAPDLEAETSVQASPAWAGAPVQPSFRQVRDERRQARFDEARRARPLVHSIGAMLKEPPLDQRAGNALNAPGRARAEAAARGVYTVRAASVIEAALATAIHSERPGPVLARVVRPVRDSQHLQHVLIPAGTKLKGYVEQVVASRGGQVVVVWTGMEFPDGRTMPLPALPAMEQTGEHGLRDAVNRHRARNFGSAALMALVGGSATYASAQAGAASGLVGASLAMELSRSAASTLQPGHSRMPTVTIRAGYRFLIYVTEDLHFEAPYR